MLTDYIEKALAMGADRLEIEYKDRKEWLTAFRGPVGVGIGSLESSGSAGLFEKLEKLKKAKKAVLSGDPYRFSFSEYESFGEWVHRIQWEKDDQSLPADAEDIEDIEDVEDCAAEK